MLRLALALASLAALCGCVSPELRAAQQATRQICAERYADPELRRLSGLVPYHELGREAPGFDMLRLERLPTAEERAALIRWGDGREQCLRLAAASFQHGQRRAASLQFLGETQAALAALTAGRISYGAFNRSYAEARDRSTERLAALEAAEAAERAAERRHDELVRELQRSRECAADPKKKGCR